MFSSKHIIIFMAGIAIIFSLCIANISVSAYDDCPYGIEDDPYPGICGRYIDSDQDGICDHSQSEPIIESDTSSQSSSDIQSAAIDGVPLLKNDNLVKLGISFFIMLVVYFALHLSTKYKVLSKAKERLVWNILLLIFFIPSALTGVFLILVVSFPVLRDFGIVFLNLHNVTSYFFMWISAYHIVVHTRYYLKGIKGALRRKNS